MEIWDGMCRWAIYCLLLKNLGGPNIQIRGSPLGCLFLTPPLGTPWLSPWGQLIAGRGCLSFCFRNQWLMQPGKNCPQLSPKSMDESALPLHQLAVPRWDTLSRGRLIAKVMGIRGRAEAAKHLSHTLVGIYQNWGHEAEQNFQGCWLKISTML